MRSSGGLGLFTSSFQAPYKSSTGRSNGMYGSRGLEYFWALSRPTYLHKQKHQLLEPSETWQTLHGAV